MSYSDGLELMLYISNVARSMVFYRDVLGFTVDGWWDDAAGGYVSVPKEGEVLDYCALRAGSQKVALHAADEAHIRGGGAVYHLRVEDVDQFHAEIARSGQVTATDPQNMPWGWRQINLQDPDGHLWGFFTPLAHG